MKSPRALALAAVILLLTYPSQAQDANKAARTPDRSIAAAKFSSSGPATCEGGAAEGYPCLNVDLVAFLTISDMVGTLLPETNEANDVWGWTDPDTGKEYVIFGLEHGTAFIDISTPEAPFTVGFLPSTNVQRGETRGLNPPQPYSSVWRDMKVYQNHAFIVADASGSHGMQVFDLTRLRDISSPPVTLTNTSLYEGFGSAHNIAINEETGFAFAVGSNSGGTTCGGGLHMIDIRTPAQPTFAGCFADPSTGRIGSGYTHDTQCVTYQGPDTDFAGREICFGSNETAISIADVTDKANPVALSRISYPGAAYVHQGWLSEDQRYFFQDDELDELNQFTNRTRTIVWDVSDLEQPVFLTDFFSSEGSIDHNQYVRGNFVYQTNYSSGLRIFNISDVENPVEVGFFDTRPNDAGTNFNGTWSNYPYFDSGIIALSSIDEGLFLVRPTGLAVDTASEQPGRIASFTLSTPFPNPFSETSRLTLVARDNRPVTIALYDVLGRQVRTLYDAVAPAGSPVSIDLSGADLPDGTYIVRARSGTESTSQVVIVRH